MPIYEFECESCGERFEELVAAGEDVRCPVCGGAGRRVYSPVTTLKVGPRGGDARRSDATRRAREEKKREDRASKRERESRG